MKCLMKPCFSLLCFLHFIFVFCLSFVLHSVVGIERQLNYKNKYIKYSGNEIFNHEFKKGECIKEFYHWKHTDVAQYLGA